MSGPSQRQLTDAYHEDTKGRKNTKTSSIEKHDFVDLRAFVINVADTKTPIVVQKYGGTTQPR